MRVYIPATPVDLAMLQEQSWVDMSSPVACALTPHMYESPESTGERDEEELEYCAFLEASHLSLACLQQQREQQTDDALSYRRLVISVDLPDNHLAGYPETGREEGQILLDPARIERRQVAAIHIDLPHMAPVVNAYVESLVQGQGPSEDVSEELEHTALAWYAPEEIPLVLQSMHS